MRVCVICVYYIVSFCIIYCSNLQVCLYWHISEESIERSWWLLGFFAGRQLHSLRTTTRMIARTASKPMTYSQATSFLNDGGRTLQLFDFLQADFAQENPEAYWNKMVGSLKARYGAWGYSIVSMFPLFFFKCFFIMFYLFGMWLEIQYRLFVGVLEARYEHNGIWW